MVWAPSSFSEAFPLTILSLVCWGSWSNSAKEAGVRKVPFPHFYTDYAFGIFASSIAWWIILGGLSMDANFSGAPVNHWRVASSLAAGSIFNVANALMCYGINLAGLSIAFPLAIGTSLVLGTVLIYLADPGQRPSQPSMLFGGVACGFVAVVAIAIADFYKKGGERARRTAHGSINSPAAPLMSEPAKKEPTSPMVSGAVCLVSGLLMSCWGPLSAYAQDKTAAGSLNPYFAFFLFALATLLTSLKPSPIAVFLYWAPDDAVGEGEALPDYYSLSWAEHSLGWIGGFVWSVGTLANLMAGSAVGLALSYSMGQSAPLVAMAWGVLYYGEFKGAPSSAYGCLAIMVLFYGAAIALIAMSK